MDLALGAPRLEDSGLETTRNAMKDDEIRQKRLDFDSQVAISKAQITDLEERRQILSLGDLRRETGR